MTHYIKFGLILSIANLLEEDRESVLDLLALIEEVMWKLFLRRQQREKELMKFLRSRFSRQIVGSKQFIAIIDEIDDDSGWDVNNRLLIGFDFLSGLAFIHQQQ